MATILKASEYKLLAKEADIQLAIVQLLDYMQIPNSPTDASRVWSKSGGVRKSKVKPGWPDVSATISFGHHKGRSLYIETKAERTGFQPGQKECHAELRRAGAIVLVPRSVSDFAHKMIESGIDHPLLRKVL